MDHWLPGTWNRRLTTPPCHVFSWAAALLGERAGDVDSGHWTLTLYIDVFL
jgi:hypothetical protein